jgi:hypothetical protein
VGSNPTPSAQPAKVSLDLGNFDQMPMTGPREVCSHVLPGAAIGRSSRDMRGMKPGRTERVRTLAESIGDPCVGQLIFPIDACGVHPQQHVH